MMATTTAPTLIKVGGHQIADAAFLDDLAQIIRARRMPTVIVHGGGKEISDLQRTLGIEPRYIDGVRVTDAPSLRVVGMVLAGVVNKRLVGHLVAAGVDAVGVTGVDRGLIRARQRPHATEDMGFTGDVIDVRADWLMAMLADGVVPVIAPLCLGADDGATLYNVNADHVAGAVGAAVGAARTVFITNVAGVLVGGQPVAELDARRAQAFIADGTINGGMIPKVQTALDVLAQGVPQAVITDLHGLKHDTGTLFTAGEADYDN